MSPEEIRRRSVVEISRSQLYDGGNTPCAGGLFDPKMGGGDTICTTDQLDKNVSPGYFGHIDLAMPVFYVQFMDWVKRVLQMLCFRCGTILVDKDGIHARQLSAIRAIPNGSARFQAMQKLIKGDSCKICRTCDARQPAKYNYVKEDLQVFAEWLIDKKTIVAPADDPPPTKVLITPEYALMLFKRLEAEDCSLLGFHPEYSRPEWMICTVLPVCPPCVRPSVKQDGNQRQEDDLTHKLVDITKCNEMLKAKLNAPGEKNVKMIESWRYILQYHIATFIDNECGLNPAQQRTGRMLKALRQRLKTKEGRIRGNLMGKRVDFSARSVITPDPILQLDQLGVPEQICRDLTVPERVNHTNLEILRQAVRNGMDGQNGAKIIEKVNGKKISLKYFKMTQDRLLKANELRFGDIVHRHLRDGDRVLFNRQPSLHRMSMMCHRVKRIAIGKTFRLNVDVTTPYNADFDGDEMNMHVPQSIESANELEELTSVYTQLIGPGDSRPCVTPVQDTMIGAYLMTHALHLSRVAFTAREFGNALMATSYTGPISKQAVTGRQAIDCILPAVVPKHSRHRVLKKPAFGAKSTGLIHVVFQDDCPRSAQRMLDDCRGVITAFMHKHGFSVGMSDLKLNAAARQTIAHEKQKCVDGFQKVLTRIHYRQGENVEDFTEADLENDIRALGVECNDAISRIIKETTSRPDAHCRINDLVDSGSKGNKINIRQIMGCLGQQEIDGKRIRDGLPHRTLPHFSKYDIGIEAHGYVTSSFIDGLNPQEFFFHAMGGREGLIDTAVKTASTGYIQRRLIKSMEDLRSEYDHTVRTNTRQIVQFLFAEDGMDNCALEAQQLPFYDALCQCDANMLQTQYSALPSAIFQSYIYNTNNKTGASRGDERIAHFPIVNYYLGFVCDGVFESNCYNLNYPIHIERTLAAIMEETTDTQCVAPEHVVQTLDERFASHLHCNGDSNGILKVLVYGHLLQDRILSRLTVGGFHLFVQRLLTRFEKARVNHGEMVGVIAAQSIGEPATQMTLNTFHYAGVGSKSKITRGVPRLTELLIATKNPKTPSVSMYLRAEFVKTEEDGLKARTMLQLTTLNELLMETTIYRSHDKARGWYMQLEISRIKLYEYRIELIDIVEELQHLYSPDIRVEHEPENGITPSGHCRLRLAVIYDKKHSTTKDQMDDFYLLKMMENTLRSVVLQGMLGIRHISDPEEVAVETSLVDGCTHTQWVLHSCSTNNKANADTVLSNLLIHPLLDPRRTSSNHISEIFEVLGIEAARQAIIDEIYSVILDSGSSISIRHIMLLADYMTCAGTHILSVDRNGMKRTEAGPLAKCSFEETDKQLYHAAVFAEVDNMIGVSSNIMLGQAAPCGTGIVQLQFDEGAFFDIQRRWTSRYPTQTWAMHVDNWTRLYQRDKQVEHDESVWAPPAEDDEREDDEDDEEDDEDEIQFDLHV
jgi:DNA-directed RNA polymerase II subunit RPB1